MANERNEDKEWQSQGESLNTGSAPQNDEQGRDENHKKGGIHNNALYAASMGRAATAQVDPHDNSGLEQTGTNPGYERPIGAGAGGSAGTGFTSGQADTGQRITTSSDYEQAGLGATPREDQNRQDADDSADEYDEQR